MLEAELSRDEGNHFFFIQVSGRVRTLVTEERLARRIARTFSKLKCPPSTFRRKKRFPLSPVTVARGVMQSLNGIAGEFCRNNRRRPVATVTVDLTPDGMKVVHEEALLMRPTESMLTEALAAHWSTSEKPHKRKLAAAVAAYVFCS